MHRWLPIMRIQICEACRGLGVAVDWEETPESFGGWQPKGAIAIGHFLKSFTSLNIIRESP